jgi:hypothetical protein
MCALFQETTEPAPTSGHEQQLSELLSKASSAGAAFELRSDLRLLHSNWPVLSSRLVEQTLLAQPDNNAIISAAIRLSGELGSTDESLLKRLVVLLDSREFEGLARAALAQICGREFVDASSFNDWYQSAKHQKREQWLESVLQQQWQQQELLWRQRLSQNPSVAVISFAMQNQRSVVREMAYASLSNLNLVQLDEQKKQTATEAFRIAIDSEPDAHLRVKLIQQAPRFLAGHEALNLLVKVVEQGKSNASTEASRQLALIEPAPLAWQALLRVIDGSYKSIGGNDAKYNSNATTRLAQWTGFSSLTEVPQEIKQSKIDLLLQRGLGQEQEVAVLEKIFVCTGRHASAEFLPILEAIIFDQTNDPLRRSSALLALTNICERLQSPNLVLKLSTALVADAEEQVRAQAIESLSRLNLQQAFELLADRLSQETQVVLQKLILDSLVSLRTDAVMQNLLVFVPSSELVKSHTRALAFQIGNNIQFLQQTVAALHPRSAFSTALTLVRSFPSENIPQQDGLLLEQLHATVLSEQLLTEGVTEGNVVVFDDAILRLQDLSSASPSQHQWLVYELKLHLIRDNVEEVFPKISILAESAATPVVKWTLALDAMAAANRLKIKDAINQIRLDMAAAEDLPNELEFRASQLYELATPPQLRDDNAEQN